MNNIESLLETVAEMVREYDEMWPQVEDRREMYLNHVASTGGWVAVRNEIIRAAKKFEEINVGEDWTQRDYLDAITEFMQKFYKDGL